ncbi:MAG: DNA translocase FtsK [Bacteroidia bacterium]|nr:DNA translocase FtsK [Bacteroidia bacterium]
MAKTKKKTNKDAGDFTDDVEKISMVREFITFIREERFKVVLGCSVIFFGVLLAISFISYLFTWKYDQSKLDIGLLYFFKSSDITVENWMGKSGALLSNLFIHKWFGLASFSFVFILIIAGFRLFRVRLLPLWRSIRYSIILTFWLSITLGFFYSTKYFYLGGAHGYFMSKWLNAFWGEIGTLLFLSIVLFAFIVFTIKDSLPWLKRVFKRKKPLLEDENEDTPLEDNNVAVILAEETKQQVPVSDIPFIIEPRKEEEPVKDETIQTDLDKKEQQEVKKKKVDEALQFGVIPVKKNGSTETQQNEVEFIIENTSEEKQISGKDATLYEPDLSVPYDPTLDLSNYQYPNIDLLEDYKSDSEVTPEELNLNKDKIVNTLRNYSIEITRITATIGSTITLYEIVPAPGVRISRIKNLEDDIALSLSALGIRIIAPMPGKGTIGIEVPNLNPEVVSMRSIISSLKFQESKHDLPVVIGKTISNDTYLFDLVKMPHLLVAGATGQGKSVGLNAILTSLLYKKHPSQLKLVLIDPKKVELTLYSKIERHFLAKLPGEEEAIICDTHKVVNTLNSLCKEMDNRYELLKQAQARNIKEYNAKFIERKLNPANGHRFLPYIVVVIDEFADLIMTAGKEVELPIARVAQLARAIGIHMIIATQRPSTNIITGTIKANFPARIAFKVASMIDSRTIIDCPGANQLVGKGDMLLSQGSELIRIQCAFVDTPEVERICDFIETQQGYPNAFLLPEYIPENAEGGAFAADTGKLDELFFESARLIVVHQQGSTSLIQRHLSIGYNRAGRIIDQLEKAGIVGAFEGSKARKVLYSDITALEQYLSTLGK